MPTAFHQPTRTYTPRRPASREGVGRLATALLIAGFACGAGAAPTLVFTPSSTTVAVGDVLQLSLTGASFNETAGGATISNVSGGQYFDFSYDAAAFEMLSITIAPRWTFAPARNTGTVDPVAGTVAGLGFGVFPPTADDGFDIATFTLRALASGSGSFSTTAGQLIGTVGGAPGQPIAATYAAVTVAITAVPEPTPTALLLLGLCAIAALRRSRMSP